MCLAFFHIWYVGPCCCWVKRVKRLDGILLCMRAHRDERMHMGVGSWHGAGRPQCMAFGMQEHDD